MMDGILLAYIIFMIIEVLKRYLFKAPVYKYTVGIVLINADG